MEDNLLRDAATEITDSAQQESEWKIPLTSPNPLGRKEIEAVLEVLSSGWLTQGERVRQFEKEFASYIGVDNAIMANSGSSANLLAFAAVTSHDFPRSVNQGKVIVPAVTWSTSIFPILQAGLTPVLTDVSEGTYTLDVDLVRETIDEDTVGIMPVHLLGQPCDMGAIMDLAEEHGLFVIEDSCEAHGAEWESQKVGGLGDMGTFSFYFSHHMTTIEGGMLVTDNDAIAETARSLRAHGWVKDRNDIDDWREEYPEIDPRFMFITEGYNLRSTELNAAIGSCQLQRLENRIEARRDIASTWNRQLKRFDDELLLPKLPENTRHSWLSYPITLRNRDKKEVTARLEDSGIQTRPLVAGNLAEQPVMEHIDYEQTELPIAERTMKDSFYVGLHEEVESPETLVEAFEDILDD